MDKKSLIVNTFKDISEITNDRFVTLRNYDLIPHASSMENDIDLLILPIFLKELIDKLKPYGYNIYQDSNRCLYGAQPHIHMKHNALDVHFDITLGLYYRSIADNTAFVNIDDKLLRMMIKNRVTTSSVFKNTPHPNDEIVHLICHCIFDKQKTTERYESQIIKLLDIIDHDQVKSRLDLIFYKAADTIFNKVINADVKDLFNTYITFKDY